jgi:hypothetical protein
MAANDDAPGAPGGPPGGGEWLTVAAAARRLGINPRSIRGRIARGTLTWKPNGNVGKLVLVPPAGGPDGEPGGGPAAVPAGGPGGEALELDFLREELADARVAAARAEERALALRELVDREREISRELRAELAEARRPWWRRLIG